MIVFSKDPVTISIKRTLSHKPASAAVLSAAASEANVLLHTLCILRAQDSKKKSFTGYISITGTSPTQDGCMTLK